MHDSRSERTTANVRAADARLAGRRPGSVTFGSVRGALEWYYETACKLQSPLSPMPSTTPVMVRDAVTGNLLATGQHVPRPRVDGGTGSHLEEMLVTLRGISKALETCANQHPRGCAALVAVVRDGRSQQRIAEEHDIRQQTISVEIGKAEAFLAGLLTAAGIVR